MAVQDDECLDGGAKVRKSQVDAEYCEMHPLRNRHDDVIKSNFRL